MNKKNQKNLILAALSEESDEVYLQEKSQVRKSVKREPVVKDKFKKPVRNNLKKEWL